MPLAIEKERGEKILEQIQNITELYIVVKEIIIFFEETNPSQKSDIQPINELRNAFDHFMRVTAAWLEIKKPSETEKYKPIEYIELHLEKCFGHVYRAGYDTVDFLALTIKDMISNSLKEYSTEDIKTAIPEYYSKIKPAILDINKEITDFRTKKDVANLNSKHLTNYTLKITAIVEHYKLITKKIPSLEEIKQKRIKEKNKNELYDWGKRIVIGIIILLVGIFIGSLKTEQSTPTLKGAELHAPQQESKTINTQE